MADPRYPVVMIGGVPVVGAPKEIDAVNAEWFRTVLLQAASSGPASVVVNMTGTRVCESAGVAVLAWAHGLTVAKGGELLLVTPADAAVARVLAFAGLDRLIPSFADLNQALQAAHAVLPRPLHRQATPSADTGLPDGEERDRLINHAGFSHRLPGSHGRECGEPGEIGRLSGP